MVSALAVIVARTRPDALMVMNAVAGTGQPGRSASTASGFSMP